MNKKESSISSERDFQQMIENNRAVLFYFSTLSCRVGEALEPKVQRLIENDFKKISFVWIDMNVASEVSAINNVFVEPTILLFIDGKEYLRKSRNIHLSDLKQSLTRLYALAFE